MDNQFLQNIDNEHDMNEADNIVFGGEKENSKSQDNKIVPKDEEDLGEVEDDEDEDDFADKHSNDDIAGGKLKSNTPQDKKTPIRRTKKDEEDAVLSNPVANPIWLSVSEAAKIGGVNTKTIRRAIQSEKVKYTIYKDRYLVGLRSLIIYLNSNKKLKNKLNFNGIGQYVKEWRK